MKNPWTNPLDPSATASILREALAGADGISSAFLFGSLAKGEYRGDSDVDVMVLGSIEGRAVSARVSRLADSAVGREINYVLYTSDEIQRRVRDRNHFVMRVIEEPKIFLVGDERELSRVAGLAGILPSRPAT